jgi:hypothetical protein
MTTTNVEIVHVTYARRAKIIGEIYRVPVRNGTIHLTFAHNGAGTATEYTPILCGSFTDSAEAEAEIERCAHEASGAFPDVDESDIDLARSVNWTLSGEHGVHIYAARVGGIMVACNTATLTGEPSLVLIESFGIGTWWFRAPDGKGRNAAELVVAALVVTASPDALAEAARPVPFQRIRTGIDLVRRAIEEAHSTQRDFPALRELPASE